MENVTQLPLFHTLPNNIDEHSLANLFTLKNISNYMCLIIELNKSSLPTRNSLETIKSGYNEGKQSRNYFQDDSLIIALEDYHSNTILDFCRHWKYSSYFSHLRI